MLVSSWRFSRPWASSPKPEYDWCLDERDHLWDRWIRLCRLGSDAQSVSLGWSRLQQALAAPVHVVLVATCEMFVLTMCIVFPCLINRCDSTDVPSPSPHACARLSALFFACSSPAPLTRDLAPSSMPHILIASCSLESHREEREQPAKKRPTPWTYRSRETVLRP